MKLSELIDEMITEAVGGVVKAQESVKLKKYGARISPPQDGDVRAVEKGTRNPIHIMEFEIGVDVELGAKAKPKLKVSAFGAGVEAGGVGGNATRTSMHRVKFTVPIRWPIEED